MAASQKNNVYTCATCGKKRDDRPYTCNDWPERFCSKSCVDAFVRPIGLLEQAWNRCSPAQREKAELDGR